MKSNTRAQIIYIDVSSDSCDWNFKNSTSIFNYPQDKFGKSIKKQMLFPEAKVCSVFERCL